MRSLRADDVQDGDSTFDPRRRSAHIHTASRRAFAALCLAVALFAAGPVRAITQNPFDPSLPLDIHAYLYCHGAADFTTGSEQASCDESVLVENPATLTYVVGHSQAASDLRTGTLRSRTISHAYLYGVDNLSATATSMAELYDTISFPGSFTGTVELRMTVTGRFAVDQTVTVMDNRIQGWLSKVEDDPLNVFDYASVRIEQASAATQPTPVPAFLDASSRAEGGGSYSTNADPSGLFLDPGQITFQLSLFVPVSPSDPSFTFLAHLDGVAIAHGFLPDDILLESDVDFGNTAQLEVIVPEGVTWTSASGVLLVPEPSGGSMLAASCSTLALLSRRRRDRRDPQRPPPAARIP